MSDETAMVLGGAGRPDKLTLERRAFILGAVRESTSIEVAAAAVGISNGTLVNWRRYARKYRANPDKYPRYEKFLTFWNDVRIAEAMSEVSLVNVIRKGAITSTADAKWLLERRHRRRWQPTEVVQHTGVGGDGPVEFILTTPKPRHLPEATMEIQDAVFTVEVEP